MVKLDVVYSCRRSGDLIKEVEWQDPRAHREEDSKNSKHTFVEVTIKLRKYSAHKKSSAIIINTVIFVLSI